MRAQDFITELGQRALPYQWLERGAGSWYGTFDAPNGAKVAFSANLINHGEGWEVSWLRDNISSRVKTDNQTTLFILSTISAMFKDFITAEKPNYIFVAMTANDPTKLSIYQRVLGKYGYSGHNITDDEEKEELDLDTDYDWWEFVA
jgi:hypothetical protein